MTSLAAGKRALETELAGLRALIDHLDTAFAQAVDLMAKAPGRVIVTGKKIAATLASTGTPAQFVHAAEASHGDMGMISPDDVILALSKSGESQELSDVLAYATRFEIPLVAITADAGSSLGQAATVCLVLPKVPEATEVVAAPTTSTTLTMALGDALAVALLEHKGFTAQDFRTFHPGGKLGAQLKTLGDVMHTGDDLPLVTPETPMTEAAVVMTEKRLGCVGVVDGQRLVGIITDGDLRRHIRMLGTATAQDLMSAQPKTLTAHTLAAEALALMNTQGITQVFVTDAHGVPQGIVHLHDLLRIGLV